MESKFRGNLRSPLLSRTRPQSWNYFQPHRQSETDRSASIPRPPFTLPLPFPRPYGSIIDMERERKQQYLRQHILDKDYDAEEFMDFCETTKGSVDIDGWTLAQLETIVNSFVRSNAKTLKTSPFDYVSPQLPAPSIDWDQAFTKQVFPSSLTHTSIPTHTSSPSLPALSLNGADLDFLLGIPSPPLAPSPPSKQSLDSPGKQYAPAESFREKLPCRQFSKETKLTGDCEVVVSGHEVVNPNIFVPKFVLYSLNTSPMNVEVQRRMKDFQLLRTILTRVFPTTQIPHLERFHRLSQADAPVIKKQKLFIESFLNSLLMNKSIRCKIIDDFLLVQSLPELKKRFAIYEKMEKPKCLQELFTPSGCLQMEWSPLNRKNSTAAFHSFLEESLEKVKNTYEQLSTSLATSAKLIQELADSFASLRNSQQEDRQLASTFTAFQSLHKQWANSFKTQQKILDSEIKHLFKYEVMNMGGIVEVNKQANDILQAYEKRLLRQEDLKEKYEKMQNGVDSPSKNLTVLKYQAAYFQTSCQAQNKRYLHELDQKLRKKMKIFSVLQLNISNELDLAWREYEQG